MLNGEVLTDEEIDSLYKEWLSLCVPDERGCIGAGEYWNENNWVDARDNITRKDYERTVEIHKIKRRKLIESIIEGKNYEY